MRFTMDILLYFLTSSNLVEWMNYKIKRLIDFYKIVLVTFQNLFVSGL